jgi:hypothetical protein
MLEAYVDLLDTTKIKYVVYFTWRKILTAIDSHVGSCCSSRSRSRRLLLQNFQSCSLQVLLSNLAVEFMAVFHLAIIPSHHLEYFAVLEFDFLSQFSHSSMTLFQLITQRSNDFFLELIVATTRRISTSGFSATRSSVNF